MDDYKFILNEKGDPIPEPDIIRWSEWLAQHDDKRIVKQEDVGEVWVSTVFTGMDMTGAVTHLPLRLWETAVFDKNNRIIRIERWRSREEAEAGHQRYVADPTH